MVVFKINVIVVRLMNINRFKLIMKVFTVDHYHKTRFQGLVNRLLFAK